MLGNGNTEDSSVPVQVRGLVEGVAAVSTGRWHTCALAAGRAQCWGSNDDGQLGHDAALVESWVPVDVAFP
jgi:hypothetical protein